MFDIDCLKHILRNKNVNLPLTEKSIEFTPNKMLSFEYTATSLSALKSYRRH